MPKDLVVKSYDIVEARYHLTPAETKLIALLTSRIERNDKNFETHMFRVIDLLSLLGMGKGNYDDVKDLTKNLMKKILEIRAESKFIQVAFLSSAIYYEGKGEVALRFDPVLKPYLLELKEKFIKYKIDQILQLTSFYSIRFYELLIKWEKIGHFRMTIKELRDIFNINKKQYPKYANIKQKILLRAQEELKQKADLYFEFKEIKTIRKVTEIEFIIKTKIDKQKQIKSAQTVIPMEIAINKKNESEVYIVKDISNLTNIDKGLIIKNQKLKNFIARNNISLKVLQELISKLTKNHNIPEQYQEDYMCYLIEHCENQTNIQSISGFFINLLKTGKLSENYMNKIVEEQQQKQDLKRIEEKEYITKLERYYFDDELKYVENYFNSNQNLFYELIEKKKDNFVIKVALNKNQGRMDLFLLTNISILRLLHPEINNNPDYAFISFEEWRTKWENNPNNLEIIEKAKKEAKALAKHNIKK